MIFTVVTVHHVLNVRLFLESKRVQCFVLDAAQERATCMRLTTVVWIDFIRISAAP